MPPVAPTNNPAPTTDYQTAYNEEGATYQPELNDVATEQQQDNTAAQQSQASLDQAKANAFTNNSLTANARGLMYSGYTPATNTSYTNNTYNPAVQNLQTKVANQNTSLQEKIQEINQNRANSAQTLVSDTQSANAEAAEKATELSDKNARAASSASSKAATAAGSSTNVSNAIRANLAKVEGGDGYVSPEDYAQAYIDWVNNGQSAASFSGQFKQFVNPNNKYYQFAINQALKRS